MRKICLKSFLAAGDTLCLTPAVESLVSQYPDEYEIYVHTSCDVFWENNPHVKIIKDNLIPPDVEVIDCNYNGIHQSNQQPVNMLSNFTIQLGTQLGIPLTCSVNKPYVYLTEDEKNWVSQVHQHITKNSTPYIVISPTIKNDYTAKAWCYWDELIERVSPWCQVVAIGDKSVKSQKIKGAINLIGQTDLRQLCRLVAHRDCFGAVGAPTLLMWLASAFEKQYWLLNGGREPTAWNSGTPMRHIFSTIGQLPCCAKGACWKSRIVPLGDNDEKDNSLCENPIFYSILPVAKCMASISAEEVALSIKRYLINRISWFR